MSYVLADMRFCMLDLSSSLNQRLFQEDKVPIKKANKDLFSPCILSIAVVIDFVTSMPSSAQGSQILYL